MERFAFFNRFNSFNLLATKVRFLNRIRVSQLRTQSGQQEAFTLIELLVVIAIIAILIGLLFPAFRAVQDQAKRTQAKNDLTQIVNAVNAYYTEYGRYPLPSTVTSDTKLPGDQPEYQLMHVLRATGVGWDDPNGTYNLNPRRIVFINPPSVKDDSAGNRRSGVSPSDGQYYDPWGAPYAVEIDGNFDNQIAVNPYADPSPPGPPGGTPLRSGVIAWSLGKDQTLGSNNNSNYINSDDVISWQ